MDTGSPLSANAAIARLLKLSRLALIELPELGCFDLHGAEAEALRWLSDHWKELSGEGSPDVVVTGGWPFFRTAELCARLGAPSVFIDAGAVPHEAMPEGAAIVQRELRRVRASALPRFTAVLPISNFIRDTQTLPERGTAAGVRTILLGADHLESPNVRRPRWKRCRCSVAGKGEPAYRGRPSAPDLTWAV